MTKAHHNSFVNLAKEMAWLGLLAILGTLPLTSGMLKILFKMLF